MKIDFFRYHFFMKNKVFDDFFYFFSKIVIFLPLFLIIISLILEFNQKQRHLPSNQNPFSKKMSFLPSPKISKISIDLKGPWQCLLKNDKTSIAAYIKDRKIKIEVKNDKGKSYFLIENDCLYQWSEDQSSGNKSCGIGPYLNLTESIIKNNSPVFFDSFFRPFKEVNQESSSLKSICKKENVEENIFKLPKKLLFKEKPLNLQELLF